MTLTLAKSLTGLPTLALLVLLAGCNKQAADPQYAQSQAQVSASRVAADAGKVVSGASIEVDKTVFAGEDLSGLRVTGLVRNEGKQALSGLELSLTFGFEQGGTVGGKIVQVYFDPAIAANKQERFQIDTLTVGTMDPAEPLKTDVLVLRVLDGPVPQKGMIVNGRSLGDPFTAGQRPIKDDSETAGQASNGGMEEERDGDEAAVESDGGG